MKNLLTPLLSVLLVALGCSPVCGQKIRPERLDSLMKRAAETHSEAVLVYENGKLVAENYFGIGKPERLIETMSCTKSIVGLAVACMLSDKLIDSLDVPVWKFYPEWKQGQKQLITLKHLVNMTSGLQNDPVATKEIYPSPDFVKLALAAELTGKPGTVWSYNNKSLNLMAGVIQQITGKRMDKYIGDRLFKPLGIKTFRWTLDDAGNPHVMAGCQVKPSDFVKFGLLVLNNGKFNGKEIISSKSLEEVLTPCELFKGYGMLWWIDYEKTISIVDDAGIELLAEAGVDKEFIDKVEQMKGVYTSDEEYIARILTVFGDNPWNEINTALGPNLKIRRREFSGKITYRADGYLGNYIIVDPEHNIVAVRMISGDSFQSDHDNFTDFREMVLRLTVPN
jgi:CubicO group peptidase (beta-lactamase class C family)